MTTGPGQLPREVFGEAPWLGLPTVYYRESDLAWSTSIWDLFDPATFEFDHAGLSTYLRFGFSAFGRTPIRGIRFCLANQRIETQADGRRKVVTDSDPAVAWVGRVGDPERVIERTRALVQTWEAAADGAIAVPLSGGYDSRFLLSLLQQPQRARAFTFGLSRRQGESFEVRYAAEVARRLGVAWRQIPLGHYHQLLPDWYALQGPSTHAHGMYQMEFFRQVCRFLGEGRRLLSGLIGDGWSRVEVAAIHSPRELPILGYTHGLHADADQLVVAASWECEENYYESARHWLAEPAARVVEAMRAKLILLSYLLRVPRHYGFQPFAPFLDLEIAMEMLCIPENQRRDRVWQREYFRRRGLLIEEDPPPADHRNTLNLQACRLATPPPLDEGLLGEIIRPAYVRWINRRVQGFARWWRFLSPRVWPAWPGVGRLRRLVGVPDDRVQAYYAYLTLYPLNALLQARNMGGAAAP